MIGSILVTVGLLLDIVGVALLLAAPRVHRRDPILVLDVDEMSRLRTWWSRLGKFGLSTVSSGFALQILGVWSQHAETIVIAAAVSVTIPLVFVSAWWLVARLPQGD